MCISPFPFCFRKKFTPVLKDDVGVISQYIYQCNAQTPTGESAFHSMMHGFGWAKNPIIKRMDKMDPEIPITLIYGSRSWVDCASGETIKEMRKNSYVNVQVSIMEKCTLTHNILITVSLTRL